MTISEAQAKYTRKNWPDTPQWLLDEMIEKNVYGHKVTGREWGALFGLVFIAGCVLSTLIF